LITGAGLALLAGVELAAANPTRPRKRKAAPKGQFRASAKRRPRRKPKRRFKVITRTFTNASPIWISATTGAASPYPSELNVAGLKQGKLLDLNVTLRGFSHTFPEDVDILLVAPNGASAVIFSDLGGGTDVSNLTFVLDNQAAAILPPESLLGSGAFKPTNDGLTDTFPAPAVSTSNSALATFNGINPNGLWRLYVADDFTTADGGGIAGGWSLRIRARVRV
jgi:subtilisin-like proprotein convertase family protein